MSAHRNNSTNAASCPLMIGHRGASSEFPENTLPAFKRAFELGADSIEFDIQISSDGVPVVFHDETLERTTNGQGPLSAHSFKKLKELDAGYFFSPPASEKYPHRGKGITIPSLEEVFQNFPSGFFAIELKELPPDAVDLVLKVIRKYDLEKKSIVGSLHHAVFRHLEKEARDFRLFTSRRKLLGLILQYYLRIPQKPHGVSLVASMPVKNRYFDVKNPRWIQWLKSRGIIAYYWTVNDSDLMKELQNLRADGIMSDNIELLKKTLRPGTAPTNA